MTDWFVGVAAVCAVVLAPTRAAAQAGHHGPAVVPPAAAYIGPPDGELEAPLPRWWVGADHPRTLWVYFAPAPPGRPDFWSATANAMATWNDVSGIPLLFQRTTHRQGADVEFRWRRRFEARQAGTTDWETDGDGWLRAVTVTLALEHEDGTPMSDEFRGLVSLHELGHAIGLPHSDEPTDVMHPGNRSFDLSDRDILSARQLYMRVGSAKVVIP
jgi:hypothetical protein